MKSTLTAQLEALLFAAARPLTLAELVKLLKADRTAVLQGIDELEAEYQVEERGVCLTRASESVEVSIPAQHHQLVKKFITEEKAALTQAKIETLTILAYQGPLTRISLEDIRGVNCAQILKNLKIDGLIDELTTSDFPTYQVSTKFLRMLGITSPADLPNYTELSQSLETEAQALQE